MRLRKVANVSELSNQTMEQIKDIYIEKSKEFMKQTSDYNNIPTENRDGFDSFFVDYMNNYLDVYEFAFLFEPIMEVIEKAAKEGIEIASEIIAEEYLND